VVAWWDETSEFRREKNNLGDIKFSKDEMLSYEEIFNCQLIELLSLLVTQISQLGSTLAPLPTKK